MMMVDYLDAHLVVDFCLGEIRELGSNEAPFVQDIASGFCLDGFVFCLKS